MPFESVRRWAGLLKTKLWCQLRDGILKGLSSILQGTGYAWKQIQSVPYGGVLLIAKIGVTEKEVYLEWLLSLLYVKTLPQNFVCPFWQLEACWLGGIRSQRGCTSIRTHNSDPNEWKVETDLWPFGDLYATEPRGQKGGGCDYNDWSDWCHYQQETG